MKLSLIVVLLAAFCCSCGDANNQTVCRQNVVEAVGTSDVVAVENFVFVARDTNGAIWLFETKNIRDPKVSAKTKLFDPQR